MISRSQVAIDACGGDQYLMIQMAAQRTREILQGAEPKVPVLEDEKPGSTAVREIEAGAYTVEDYNQRSK
jgi:DNA-directed RNA polymerase omega subunit